MEISDLIKQSCHKITFTLALLLCCIDAKAQHKPYAIAWDGDRLVYYSDAENNRIPDYSHAGYRGGGINLPNVPVKIEIGPVEGDNRAHIQNAINQVSKMRLDSNGHRGAVLLKPGRYWINGNLFIRESGVVLRGSGDDENASGNTVILVSQSVTGDVLQIGNEDADWSIEIENSLTTLKTPYLPVGARSFEVHDPEKFQVGDNIILRLISTPQWLESVNGGGTESDPAWEPGELDMFYNRTVVSKQNNVLNVDAPVYNHINRRLSNPVVYRPIRDNLITESGVENLRIEIQTGGELTEGHAENGVVFRGVENVWARDVTVLHFVISGFSTHTSKNVTIKDSRALEPHSKIEPTKRYNFNADKFSNNILFQNVRSSFGRRDFIVNGASTASGIVFQYGTVQSTSGSSEGHRRWSQGLLYDSIDFINPQIFNVLSLHNRGDFGTGHGWSAVHSTAWNIEAEDNYIVIQKPPGAQNYAIGNKATVNGLGFFSQPEGYIEGTGISPVPTSLYDAQLAERLKFGSPPDMPLEFMLSVDQKDALTIFWKQLLPDDSEIVIERSENGSTFREITKAPAGDEMYVDQNVIKSEYTYRIQAFSEGQYSAFTFPKSAVPQFNEPPVVSTGIISEIEFFSARGSGNVTNSGTAEVTDRGICWDTNINPNLSDSCVSGGSGLGSFSIQLTSLQPNTNYFVRAYATNSVGTSFGNERDFKTLKIPPDPDLSEISTIDNDVIADGTDEANILVKVLDKESNALGGYQVELFSDNNRIIIEENIKRTNRDGEVIFYVTSDEPTKAIFGAVAEGIKLSQTVEVTYIPVAPVALNATAVKVREFVANWEMVDGASSYELDVSSDINFQNKLTSFDIKNVGNVTNSLVTEVSPGSDYWYRVRALASTIIGPYSDTIKVSTFPDIPLVGSPSNIGATYFTANWEEAEGADSYLIDVSNDENFAEYIQGFESLNVGNSTSFEVDNLRTGTTYFYRVRSVAEPRISSNSGSQSAPTLELNVENSIIESTQLRVLANGDQPNNINVFLKGNENQALNRITVILSVVEGSAKINQPVKQIDQNGFTNFEVTSLIPNEVTYTVSADGKEIGQIKTEFLKNTGSLVLGNNYPNPFLSTTIIPVSVPQLMDVHVSIYDSIGKPVKTVLDETKDTGYYEIEFTAEGLASGVYFYRLITDSKIIVQKMIYVK